MARNRTGAQAIENLAPLRSIEPDELVELQRGGAVVLDTRPAAQFAAAHVPGSVHIALSGQYASWAARVLGIDARVVLVGEDDAALEESRLRLARVGLENVDGALAGGILGWIAAGKTVESIDQISAQELAGFLETEPAAWTVLDVRETSERASGAIPGSISIPLPELKARMGEVRRGGTVAVHCKGGYRSAIAASLLQAAGIGQVVNLVGGYDAWGLRSAGAAEQAGVGQV